MRKGGQRHAPASYTRERLGTHLYRRLGGPQGRSGRVRKISPLPGFDPRTVQPVTSRYTDWVIPAHFCSWSDVISSLHQGGLDGRGVLNAIKKGGKPLKILARQNGRMQVALKE